MRKSSLLFFVLLTFLASCQLQKVVVTVYTPSKLAFPPEVRSVLATSRFVPATGPYEDVQWGAYESVDSLKWSLSESIVDSLGKRMAVDNKYLIKIKHLPRMLRHNEANLPEPLPWAGLSELAKKEYVQTLLVIEGFGLSRTPLTYSESNGNIKAGYSIGVTLGIRIYEPDKMRMIDDSVYTFSTAFEGLGKTEPEAAAKLPEDLTALFTACSNAADSYFALINPGEFQAERYYYNGGDSSMIKADQALKEGKWGRAESKWKWLAYNAKDSTLQAKASYNMAVACERDGRINQSLGFARRSQRINPDKHTEEYIRILEKRISDYDEQVKQRLIIRRW